MGKMDRIWEAEKYALSKMTMAFLPRRMLVKDAEGGELGYTRAGDAIYIAKEHEAFSMLAEAEKAFFRKGVFAHEMLHQIFTDFEGHRQISVTMSPVNARVFGLIANVLEDPAIEYWSQTKFGGSLLKSLRFSIAHIYKQSPNIEDSEGAFAQFINALIQFGDMGLLKGHFTFPEAKDIFLEVAPVFNRGILEADGKKRLYLAKQIMEISRPLWEEEAKAQEEFMEKLKKLMEEAGKSEMRGCGSGEKGDSDSLPDGEGVKEKRRSVTISSLDDESEDDSSSGSASETSASPSSPSPSSSDETSKSSSTSSSKKEEGEKEEGENESSSSSTKEEGGKEDGSKTSSSDKEEKEGEEKGEKETSSTSEKEGEKEEDTSTSIEEELSEEDRKSLEAELKKALEEMKREEEREKRDDTSLESCELKCGKFIVPESKILNKRAECGGNSYLYASTVEMMQTGISNTTRQLKRLLAFACEDTEYATRGKININRLNCGKSTARVFDKKRIPNNIADLVIGVAVDLSGSMSGNRIEAARNCCIAIAEICHNLNVPLYVMGYTGDINKYTLVHRHYVTWKNSKQDRESLAGIRAECQNYDGASFRYFTNIMRKKQSKHKLMIIISDGEPAGPGYCGPEANRDTAMAIRDAKKVCDVLGVAIGNDCTEILQSFYGNDFMHVSKPNDLFVQLSVKIKKFVHKWMNEE